MRIRPSEDIDALLEAHNLLIATMNTSSVFNSQLYIDGVNNTVDVGTTSPSTKLDVNVAVKIGTDSSTCNAAGGKVRILHQKSWDIVMKRRGQRCNQRLINYYFNILKVLSPALKM